MVELEGPAKGRNHGSLVQPQHVGGQLRPGPETGVPETIRKMTGEGSILRVPGSVSLDQGASSCV